MPNLKDRANIWVPPSFSDRQAALVGAAVRDYDPNLGFGRNERSGQWCIFLKQGSSALTAEADLPILGFDEIPHPDDALKRLHKTDARRTGNEILDNLRRVNDDINNQRETAAKGAVEETAEAFDWGFRQMGKAPHTKVFIK